MKRFIPILLLLLPLSPASAYTAYKTVSFGPTQTAQAVTYTVKDNTNTTVSAGVSGTVIELGGGAYASAITVPDGANYFIVWSETNSGTTYTASDKVEATATAALATLANQTSIITTTTSTNTLVAALPTAATNATAVWGATTKTVTGGTVTTVTNAVVLPTTPPTGYGGSTGDTPGTTSLLAKIGTPAGASLSADVAAVKSDTGSLVTSVASLPAANATAVWGSTTRALTDKANFALVSTEYANIAAVTTTYGFDGPPAGTILTLTITRNGSSQPVLTWTADPAATLYKVYRSTDGANYTVIATPATGTLTYTDTARPAGATVYYHITSTH